MLPFARHQRFQPLCVLLVPLMLAGLFVRSSTAQTRAQFEQLRSKMVRDTVAGAGVKHEGVLKAMAATPRHEFVAPIHREKAYLDMALPIGEHQTISSPFIVAYMTQSLDPKPTDRVLEIGTGSGFQAAVLSPLVKEVYSIEIVEELGVKAAKLLKKLGYENVYTRVGDGYQGWAEHAPFDKIIVTCSPEKVPDPLAEQLAEGGLMVVPVGERYSQTLYLFRKKEGKLVSEALLPTLFVPMTGKAEDQRVVKPDPKKPHVTNGGFEEETLPGGAQPGWYYERQVTWETSDQAPAGKHFISFTNKEAGVPAHLLQGFAIDGRAVPEIELSARVKHLALTWGKHPEDRPSIVVTLYDENRRELGHHQMGPFRGDAEWSLKSKRITVPKTCREGLLRVGLFGATGTLAVDDVAIQPVSDEKR